MKPFCAITTPAIEKIAKELGRPAKLVTNAVSIIQTRKQSMEEPTKEEIQQFFSERRPQVNGVQVNQNDDFAALARDYTPRQQQDRAVAIARIFSDIVSRKVEEKIDELNTALNEAHLNNNLTQIEDITSDLQLFNSDKGRQIIIQEETLQGIFKEMKSTFQSEVFNEQNDEYVRNEYQKLVNNFDALLENACTIIEGVENIRIIPDKHTYHRNNESTEVVTGGTVVQTTQDEDIEEQEFGDDEEGTRVTGNDGWNFQVRFIDPYTSLSKNVKRILSNIIRVDAEGNEEFDDLGNLRYLNPEYAHTALLNIMSSIVDVEDFNVKDDDGNYSFPVLERAQARYPWISQVIAELESNPDLVGSFYADLRKDFIPYSHQYEYTTEEGNTYTVTHYLNQNTATESSFNRIEANYEQGTILDVDSIYKQNGNIDSEKSSIGIETVDEVLSLLRDFDEDDYDEITTKAAKVLRMVGVDINKHAISNILKSNNGIQDVESVLNSAKYIFQGLNEISDETNLLDQFQESYKNIASKVGVVDELDNIASFRQDSKTRYSYSAPNYIESLLKRFRYEDEAKRNQFLEEEFGRYEWFRKDGKWRSEWLRLLAEDENVRFQLASKELISLSGKEYTDWKANDIKYAFVTEYFSIPVNEKAQHQYAWYNMPIFSDSPVVKFIKGVRYTGDYKRKLLPLFREVVKQEIDRIKLVEQRRINHAASIQNFDANGDRFHFFPELNSGNLKDEALSLHGDELNSWIDEKVEIILNNLYGEFIANAPLKAIGQNLKASGIIKGTTDAEIDTATQKALEEYFWNQAYATTQIIELTTTDLAFYKDDTDFQKRYKEVYAAGTKLNTLSKYGKETRKSLYLIDQIITSGEYTNIKKSLDKAVELGHIQSFDRDNILNKFKDINVADAQAYVSPKSMRSILDMMGAWTDEMETSFQRFERGEWDMSDFNTIWQTIKPFVYTQLSKPDGLGGIMKVPHQNKNSEFLLLAAYNMIANVEASPKLRALQRFMSDNDIDVIQFESAVKAGGQGRIDLNYSPSRLEAAYRKYVSEEGPARIDEFKESLDYALDKGKITQEEYNKRFKEIEPTEQEVYNTLYQNAFLNGNPNNPNPEVVHEIPYRDYVIQQPTPEHLLDTEAVFGSQLRNLIIADLPEDIEIEVNGKKLNRQQILDLYQACIVENLLEDYSKVSGRFTDIHRLQEALLNQVKGNVKFSRDMVNALQIVEVTNPYTGEKEEVFNLPLNNPNTTVRLQELVTSMFKNAVTKQHIKGGACILVSDWGMTDELQVRHDPKTGRVTGIECYLPAYSKQFYEPFMVTKTENGVTYQELDVKKLQKAGLDKLVGYRIPTEDKYSMAPLIVKGFLPQQNGSSIMLPADITQIAGSDFDIDKMFLMIPEFRALNYNYTQAKQDYQAIISDDAVTKLLSSIFQDNTDLEDAMNEAPNDFKEWFEENKEKYRYETPRVVKVKYDTTKTPQKNSRAARNNMLIDIIHGILTDTDTAEKIHNPGNFDKAKLQARITEIITDRNILSEFQEYFNLGDDLDLTILTILDISERGQLKKVDKFLKDYKKKYNTTRSQLTIDTFCYNHTQNMTGGALIGMYANNTTMQAKYQHSNLAIKDNLNFFINGRRIQSLHDTISGLGERISSNCAQFSAASVDNVKDPVLAKLLQNTNTANITGFMLRVGMSIEEISLMFAQPLVRQCILDTGSLDNLEDYALAYQESTGITFSQEYLLHEYTSEELLRNVLTNNPNQQQNIIDATYLMMHIVELSKTLSELTQISRADSPNGAISNSIGGAKLQVSAVKRYMDQSKGKKFPFTGLEDAMQYHYVDVTTSKDGMRTKFLNKKMPMLQAFYSLGIELGTSIIGNYFQQINAYSDDLLETILDTAPNFVVQNKKVGTKVIETFYKDLVQFGLTKTKLFGDDDAVSESIPSITENPPINNSPILPVQKHVGDWTRTEAMNNPRILYVFTDNTDRDSGSGVIPADSWYSRKYGVGHHYPTMTAAVIRGLDNVRPISTMHYFYKTHGFTHPRYDRNSKALWHDSDVEEFKNVVREELEEIVKEFNTGKYDKIMFPDGDGLFNTNISNITKQRTPKLYQALADLLYEFGFSNLIPSDVTPTAKSNRKVSSVPFQDSPMTFEEKRDYYLKEFPKKYLQILEANPEIKKLGLFKKIGVKNGRIILARSARMRQNAKDTLMRDMDTLLYMGPEAQELARDLFMYAFYENGFSFGPNSFGNFFSTNFINAFPEVVTALRNMKAEMKKGTYFDEFLPQFYANHSNDLVLTNIVNIDRIKLKEGEQILIGDEGQIFLPSRLVFNSNTLKYDFKYIRINTEKYDIPSGLYVMTSYGDNNVCYVKAPEFKTQKYNANMTATEMLDYDETSAITDNLADPFVGMSDEDMYDMQFDGFGDDTFMNDFNKYDESTSQSQLDNPMCK